MNIMKKSIQKGLPSYLYNDEKIFKEEYNTLFKKNWFGLAFSSICPDEGDVVPVEFMQNPFLLVRDREKKLRVFYNVCPHRGVKLMDCPLKKQPFITCPYHSWSYQLNGLLFKTPHIGGENIHDIAGFVKDHYALYEVPNHEFMGVIYINPSKNKGDFEMNHKKLKERWKHVWQDQYYTDNDSYFSLSVQSNWKLAVENYCESYHLPKIHPELNSYSKLSNHYHIEEQQSFSGQGTKIYNPAVELPVIKNVEGTVFEEGGEYISLFPNVLLGAHRDHVFFNASYTRIV